MGDSVVISLYAAADVVMFLSAVVIGLTLYRYRNRSFQMTSRGRVLGGLFMMMLALSTLSRAGNLFVAMYRLDVLLLSSLSGIAAATALIILSELRRRST